MLAISSTAQMKGSAIFLKGGYINARGAGKELRSIQNNNESFTDNFLILGLEVDYRKDSWIAGVESSIGAQKAKTVDIQSLKPFTGAAHIQFGYIIWEGKEYWFYPTVGFGVSRHNLTLKEKIYGKKTKIDNFNSYAPSVSIGFNGDLLTTKETKDQTTSAGLVLGYRIGYRFSLKDASWKNEERQIIRQNSSYRNDAFYLSLVVGFGAYKNTR